MRKFRDTERRSCEIYVGRQLSARGVESQTLGDLVHLIVRMSSTLDFDEDGNTHGDAMALMMPRKCWVIRTEDLDVVGTAVKYAAPIAAAGATIAAGAGATAAAPIAAGIAGVVAFVSHLALNMSRKGVTLDPTAIRTLAILKTTPEGVSVNDLVARLEASLEQPFTASEVAGSLNALRQASLQKSDGTVAVAYERHGLWFAAV